METFKWTVAIFVSFITVGNLKNKRRQQNVGNDVKLRTKEECQCFELERYIRILFSIARDY